MKPTAAEILAALKAELYGNAAFDHAAYDDADHSDRRYLDGMNACRAEKVIATPRMRDDYMAARRDTFADERDLCHWGAGDAEDFAFAMRREFLS